MLFLNPWMLMGLLGVSIPLMLHLFNRRRQNRREWGAMMFLEASLAQRRRRVLVEEILLLATRCLIVGLGGQTPQINCLVSIWCLFGVCPPNLLAS